MIFDKAVKQLFQHEGYSYTNDPDDHGGETVFGIAKKNFPEYCLRVYNLMKEGALESAIKMATEFYHKAFWNPLYQSLDEKLAIKLFNVGVNIGVNRSVKTLQSTLRDSFKKDIVIDGKFGQKTIKACNSVKYQPSLYSRFIFDLSKYYESLNQDKYMNGWLNRLYS